jgi:hypothetical protein
MQSTLDQAALNQRSRITEYVNSLNAKFMPQSLSIANTLSIAKGTMMQDATSNISVNIPAPTGMPTALPQAPPANEFKPEPKLTVQELSEMDMQTI